MEIYVTTLIRYKNYGFIYKVKFPNEIKRKSVVRNRTEIAKHGGPHGLAWLGESLVTGTYDDIRFYDSCLELQATFSHPFLSGVHGISTDDDRIWVSSCNNEGVLCFDQSGQIQESHFLVEHEKLMEMAGRVPKTLDKTIDFRTHRIPYGNQPFHVNDVAKTESGLEVSLHKLGMVYDLHQDRAVASIPSDDIHDGRSYGDRVFMNDTGACRVVRISPNDEIDGQAEIDVMELASSQTKVSIYSQKALQKTLRAVARIMPRYLSTSWNCRPNWLRGLQVIDENHVLVGTSPAAVALVNFERGTVVDFCQLSNRLCEAVFAIVTDESNT